MRPPSCCGGRSTSCSWNWATAGSSSTTFARSRCPRCSPVPGQAAPAAPRTAERAPAACVRASCAGSGTSSGFLTAAGTDDPRSAAGHLPAPPHADLIALTGAVRRRTRAVLAGAGARRSRCMAPPASPPRSQHPRQRRGRLGAAGSRRRGVAADACPGGLTPADEGRPVRRRRRDGSVAPRPGRATPRRSRRNRRRPGDPDDPAPVDPAGAPPCTSDGGTT